MTFHAATPDVRSKFDMIQCNAPYSCIARIERWRYKGLDLSGKSAVVIGGTSGIGHAVALGLAEAGADVAADLSTGRHGRATGRPKSKHWVASLCAARPMCTTASSLEQLLAEASAHFGKVDILINCAGRIKRAPTLDFRKTTGTPSSKRTSPELCARPRCSAATCSSAATDASFTLPRSPASWPSTKWLPTPPARPPSRRLPSPWRLEWGPRGVCVNAIAPGVFPTDLNRSLLEGTARGREFLARIPMKRFGNVEELCGAAIFLSSDAASYVNGEVIVVDGGFMAGGVNQ